MTVESLAEEVRNLGMRFLQNCTGEHREEFQAAMRGVRVLFRACSEAAERFARSVESFGGSAELEEEFRQDRDLWLFVEAGQGCFEHLHYALFALGAAVVPESFAFASEDERRKVNRGGTLRTWRGVTADAWARLLDALEALDKRDEYQDWVGRGGLRAKLFHRGLPGRVHDFSQNPGPSKYRGPGGLPIEPETTRQLAVWLEESLRSVLSAAARCLQSQTR